MVNKRKLSRLAHDVGRVAADTLGFIGGDIPGAYAADRAYNALTEIDNNEGMARPRKRVKTVKKKKTIKKKTYKSKKFNAKDGTNNFQSAHIRAGPKVASRAKGRKTLKLTKRFKKAVKQVIRNFGPKGFYTERYYARYVPGSGQQTVADLGLGWLTQEAALSSDGTNTSGGLFFDPTKVIYAASNLFHGKSPAGNKNLTDSGVFDPDFFEVDVLRQWVRLEFKNNTSRYLVMKLYTWQLKDNDSFTSFGTEWQAQSDKEKADDNGRLNVAEASISTIGHNPMICAGMRRKFSIEEKEIRFEPGKTYVHLVQGASMLYNYASFKEAGAYHQYQKMVKGVCMLLYPDMTGTTTVPFSGGVGDIGHTHRWSKLGPPVTANWSSTSPYGVLVETTYNYVMRLPEQAGFKIQSDVVGTNTILDNRVANPYYIKTWDYTGVGQVTPIENGIADKPDEEPAQVAQFGV